MVENNNGQVIQTTLEQLLEKTRAEAYAKGYAEGLVEGNNKALEQIHKYLGIEQKQEEVKTETPQQVEMEIEKGETDNGQERTTNGQPTGPNINFG